MCRGMAESDDGRVFLDIVMCDAPEVGRGRLGKDKVSIPSLTKQCTQSWSAIGDCGGGCRWRGGWRILVRGNVTFNCRYN